MPTMLTAHFALEEFIAVSKGPLTESHRRNATHFATQILEPARKALNFPIVVTSFYRPNDERAHGTARAIDFQPCKNCAEIKADPSLFDKRLEQLFSWLATFKTQTFGQLIHERNHLHASMPGYNGQTGAVYREPIEGEYVLASWIPPMIAAPIAAAIERSTQAVVSTKEAVQESPALALVPVLVFLLVLYALRRKGAL